MKMSVNVNGFSYDVSYSDSMVENLIKPLIHRLTYMNNEKGTRLIVFLAAPPAVGKSTFAYVIEKLSGEMEGVESIQSLSLDGFHYKNEFLKQNKAVIEGEERYLSEIKGMPETFDITRFKAHLQRLQCDDIVWPIYDRNIHDVDDDGILVESKIVIIEGNWLMLDETGWSDLNNYCDYSIFIKASEELLKERLISRKVRGGMSSELATDFYYNSDRKNIFRVMDYRLEANLELEMQPSGEYKRLKEI